MDAALLPLLDSPATDAMDVVTILPPSPLPPLPLPPAAGDAGAPAQQPAICATCPCPAPLYACRGCAARFCGGCSSAGEDGWEEGEVLCHVCQWALEEDYAARAPCASCATRGKGAAAPEEECHRCGKTFCWGCADECALCEGVFCKACGDFSACASCAARCCSECSVAREERWPYEGGAARWPHDDDDVRVCQRCAEDGEGGWAAEDAEERCREARRARSAESFAGEGSPEERASAEAWRRVLCGA